MSEVNDSGQRSGAPIRLGYLNLIVLIGRVATDPDIRYMPKGSALLMFRVAVNRRYKDPTTEEWKEQTSFFPVNVWGQQAERLSESMRKGSAVLIEGELRSRTYEVKSTGEKQTVVEINARRVQLLDRVAGGAAPPTAPPVEGEPDLTQPDVLDDIPF